MNFDKFLNEVLEKPQVYSLKAKKKFSDPESKINLPQYSGDKGSKAFSWFKKDDEYLWDLASQPAIFNKYEETIYIASSNGHIPYPKVEIKFNKFDENLSEFVKNPKIAEQKFLGETKDLLFLSHRVYDGIFLQNGSWNDKNVKNDFMQVYNVNLVERNRAVLKYSPITLLFGGWGSHLDMGKGPKINSIVSAEIRGSSGKNGPNADALGMRRGMGSFMTPCHLKNEGEEKGSAEGVQMVPLNSRDSNNFGAIYLKNVNFECQIHLSRLFSLMVGDNSNDNHLVRKYLLSLWFYMVAYKDLSDYDFRSGCVLSSDDPIVFEYHNSKMDISEKEIVVLYKDCYSELLKKGLILRDPVCYTLSDDVMKKYIKNIYKSGNDKDKEKDKKKK